MSPRTARGIGIIAVIFGIMTLFSGGTALFGGAEAKALAGNAVPFVLWFNFVSGVVYIAAGLGITLHKPWAGRLAMALALAILGVFALFIGHIITGGAFEMRTVGAMTFRAAFWIAIALAVKRAAR